MELHLKLIIGTKVWFLNENFKNLSALLRSQPNLQLLAATFLTFERDKQNK